MPFRFSGIDNQHRGTQLLEIYALEIQMHTSQKNNKKLKQLYEASLHIKSAIPHPLIMGLYVQKFFFSFNRIESFRCNPRMWWENAST